MERGLLTAIIVSAAWMLVHLLLMQRRPAENRFKAMTVCWLFSLPFIPAFYFLAPSGLTPHPADVGDSIWMGLLQAGLSSVLLYFLFVECFYHVERAVTLRILIELLNDAKSNPTIESVRSKYDVDEMIRRRLDVLADRHFIARRDDRWHLLPKGRLFARTMQFSCWLFQCKGQKDRG
ncbi:MAG TPA: hypothetical protein DCZ95_07295 [Verrucomicrobia bacterium]|nr:MAG: hypothetical protein A2X46_13760 [Lentisphaerae bacterium GWF2_57_35]HBA83880.1 hypothetical protein [Verrucomicrobiota bacterium]